VIRRVWREFGYAILGELSVSFLIERASFLTLNTQ
jgi:hypothetical protein